MNPEGFSPLIYVDLVFSLSTKTDPRKNCLLTLTVKTRNLPTLQNLSDLAQAAAAPMSTHAPNTSHTHGSLGGAMGKRHPCSGGTVSLGLGEGVLYLQKGRHLDLIGQM